MSRPEPSGFELGPPSPRVHREGRAQAERKEPELPTVPIAGVPQRATRLQRAALLAGLIVVAWLVLRLFASILLPFVAAAGIAYFLDPLARRMVRLGVPRSLAALVLIVALVAISFLVVFLLYPLVVQQVELLVARVPDYIAALRGFAQHITAELQHKLGPEYFNGKLQNLVSNEAGTILTVLVQAITRIIGGGFALFNVLSLVIVTPVVAFYLLRDWPKVVARVDSWLPRRYARVLRAQAHEVDRILSAWIRGQLLVCLFFALFYAAGLSLSGLDLGLIVGLAAGLLSFIPYVGTIVGVILSVALALAQFPLWPGLIRVAAVFGIGQILSDYLIYPRFLGDRVELSAVWVIFALFAGGAAFGFLGILLAVPVAAVIGVLARFWLRRYMQSSLYLDPPPADEGR